MGAKTLEDVRCTIEAEGFDYAFRSYSDFKGVEDEEFHRLRLAYKEAADALYDYLYRQHREHLRPLRATSG